MAKFENRERELRALERACGERPGLVVMSGRRRVGKTALLDHFAGDRRAVFLAGTRAPVPEALRRLEDRIRAAAPPEPGDLLDLGHLRNWDTALGYLLARSRAEPLLLVLDEFPYLCETDPSLPSTLQARWDHRGDARLSIVLAGSHVGLMEQLVAADAPLFGRADAHVRLTPFSWRDAALLIGGGDPETWLEAYVTVGGMPRYLTLWDPRHDPLTNLADLLDGPGAALGEEGTVVLQEVTPGSSSARVLEAVALGSSGFTAIRSAADLAPATTSEALAGLEALGLVERLTPAGQDPKRTKRVRYQLRDPFLQLWLAVVGPHREAFELGRGASVLSDQRARIAGSQQMAFARVVRDWLAERESASCGPWWPTGQDRGIDALALHGGRALAAAAAHWATGVDGESERDRIDALLAGGRYEGARVHVVARSGTRVATCADLFG